MSSIDRMYQLVSRPVITEKGTMDQAERNTYHFRVPLDANKVEVRMAVEKVFDVKVTAVNIQRVRGKRRRRGWVAGQRPDWKKARVKLGEKSPGEYYTIDIL